MSRPLRGTSFSYLIADINKYEIIFLSVAWACDFHPFAPLAFWMLLIALLFFSIETVRVDWDLSMCFGLRSIPSTSWIDIGSIQDFVLVLAWLEIRRYEII